MTTFTTGEIVWKIELDSFLLDDVAEETGVDLVDIEAGGLAKIGQSTRSLLHVLRVLCRDQCKTANLSERDFSKLLKGDVLAAARKAVLGSVQAFFPESEWSVIQSNLKLQEQLAAGQIGMKKLTEAAPLMEAFMRLSEAEQEKLIADEGGTSSDLQILRAFVAASGQPSTPAEPAESSPENAELVPAG